MGSTGGGGSKVDIIPLYRSTRRGGRKSSCMTFVCQNQNGRKTNNAF